MYMSVSAINSLLSVPLINVVVQGGKFELSPNGQGCLLFCIWFENSNGWFELTAIEYENESEFGLFLKKSNFSPLLEKSKFTQPPLKLVESFPSFCQLDLLKNNIKENINVEFKFINLDCKSDIVKSIRLFSSNNSFEFKASDKYPENVEIHQKIACQHELE